MNFINSYIAEKHVVEEALKERHLIAKGVRIYRHYLGREV